MPTSPATGTILFTRECEEPGIYAIEVDGSNERRIIKKTGSREAAWSPDGTQIAFQALTCDPCTTEDTSDLYLLNIADSTQIKLLGDSHPYRRPSWSPDGTHIAFSNGAVYTLDMSSSAKTRLHTGVAPAWSPDGTRIAFVALGQDEEIPPQIFVMHADGSHVTQITQNKYFNAEPHWSPDGSRIVFFSDRDGNIDVYVMHADGSNEMRLTDDPATDYFPVWSPDGSRIAFSSDRNGNLDIYIMNDVDGSQVTRLTDNESASDYVSDWRP
jgi:Tol biopolymer transport system component